MAPHSGCAAAVTISAEWSPCSPAADEEDDYALSYSPVAEQETLASQHCSGHPAEHETTVNACRSFGTLCSELSARDPQRHSSFGDRSSLSSPTTEEQLHRQPTLKRQPSDGMDAQVAGVISFKGKKHLLRACRSSTVLRYGAAILGTSHGSEVSYDLSEEVDQISAFISHNWAVPRMQKFISLSLHFNIGPAIVSVIVALGVIAVGTYVRVLPLIATPEGGQRGITATLLVAPLFIVVLFGWHEVQRGLGLVGPTVFLDKVCIHQSDKSLQQEGINKLGAFIRSSSKMVAIYTDVYLTKLWTVYEVACFLSLHDVDDLTIVPTSSPLVMIGGLLLLYVGTFLKVLMTLPTFGGASSQGQSNYGYALGILALALPLRYTARMKESIRQRMEHFDVDACTCFDEKDRPVIYKNITMLMRATGAVNIEAPDQDALNAFNHMVRCQLFSAVVASIGPLGIRYSHVVALFLCTYVAQGVDYYFGVAATEDVMRVDTSIVGMAVVAFGILPTMVASLSLVCGRCLHLRGCYEVGYIVLAAVFILLYAIFASTLCLYAWRLERLPGLLIMSLQLAVWSLLARAFFRRSGLQPQQQQRDEDEEPPAVQKEPSLAVAV